MPNTQAPFVYPGPAHPLRPVAFAPVSVVIVNFNAGDFLAAAVESVFAQTGIALEVIVVDNASRDHSLAQLRARVPDPRLRIVEARANTGFAAACNAGLAAARGDPVLFLNPDCRMRAGALEEMLAELSRNPEAGMAGPLIVNPEGNEQRGCRRDIPNPWQIFCVAFGLHRLMPEHPRFRAYTHDSVALPSGPSLVPAISGACMLVRRRAMDVAGTLDPAYFLHFEDLDWCLRFERAGLGVLFVPGAVVEHTQGVCSASRPFRAEAAKHRSLVRFLRKNFTAFYPSSFMAAVSMLVGLRFGLVALRMLIRRRSRRTVWDAVMRGPRGTLEPPRAQASPLGGIRPDQAQDKIV